MKSQSDMIDRILDLIKKNGMTAKQFTQAMGIGATSVSEWKSGRTQPSVDHVRKMSELLNVSTDYIITGREFRERLHEETQLDRLTAETMGAAFARLTGESRDIVMHFILDCVENINKYGDTVTGAEGASAQLSVSPKEPAHRSITDGRSAMEDLRRRMAKGEFNDVGNIDDAF